AAYAVVPTGGTWSLNLATAIPPGSATPAAALAAGTYNVTATITDAAGNAASDTTTGELVIDITAPTVTAVTSPTADGSYRATQTITIQVQLSKSVIVDTTLGSPTLALNSGRNATFVNAVGNVLNFTYSVQNGDTAADLNATALTLNGATIKDSAGNTLTLTLPVSQATGSLDLNKAIVIDTTAPAAPVVTALTTNVTPPTITGSIGAATLATGETLTVVVNGATYTNVPVTAGVGGANGTWSLNLATIAPTSGTLGAFANGSTFNVVATVTDAAGNATSDVTTNELRVITTIPTAPTVNALLTNSTTPTITGLANLAAGQTLAVVVNGAAYAVVPTGGTWSLNLATAIPPGSATPAAALAA
ncbi:MAG: hypothetical protein EBV34_22045, partial [Betaproteobacteria bacterium]|nr:hypothetical protein [Betaproteobacteria bacterium]